MKPTIVAELIRQHQGFDEGELIEAFWDLYEAVREEHSGQHFESECPTCASLKAIEILSSEDA